MIALENYNDVLDALRQRTGVQSGPLCLISFTIAGVQQFLDSARTTRDVWNGSYLISSLMWKATEKALEQIRTRQGLERGETARFVLIPAIEPQPFWQLWGLGNAGQLDIAQFPNAVLLAVPGDEKAARRMAGEMELAVQESWRAICEAAREPLKSVLNGYARKLWDYQLGWRRRNGRSWQQIFEVYSAIVQLPDAAGFQQLAQELGLDETRGAAGQLFELPMRLLAARKSLRDFEQYAHEGHRCSLCGQRTALTNELSYEGLRDFWARVRGNDKLKYTFRDQDRLCAVCTVRRLAPVYYFQGQFPQIKDKIWFPSTSTIAVASWVREVTRKAEKSEEVGHAASMFGRELRTWQRELGIEDPPEALVPAFEVLQGNLRDFAYCDGRWFYPESYEPEQLRRDFDVDPDKARQHPSGVPAPLSELRKLVASAPDDYFAVIMADGDRMGEWMSGRQDPERFNLDWQQQLSAALADFAEKARTRLEQWIPAKVVYAGGDDVLAFVPRRCLLEALTILDLTFDQCVRRPLGYHRDSIPTPSLSAGCVVAKHKDPMKGAIVRAHEEMLKDIAKVGLGRNAFAVYRTTEGVPIGAPFHAAGRRTLRPLRFLLAAFRARLSPRVRWELANLAEGLREWPSADALRTAQCRLIRRSFERHFEAPAGSKLSEAVCKHATHLFDILRHWADTKSGSMPVDPFRAFLDLLGLLIFLARHD